MCLGLSMAIISVLTTVRLAADTRPPEQPAWAAAGIPVVRSYSLNEIGASRGAQLSVDHLGRVAVVSGQSILALNDNTWIDLLEDRSNIPLLYSAHADQRNRYFYGTQGSWGQGRLSPGGLVQTFSMRPEQYPQWVQATNFSQILTLDSGVIFAGYNGLVYDRLNGEEPTFKEISELIYVFELNGEVYLSSHTHGILRLDLQDFSVESITAEHAARGVAKLDANCVLMATVNGRLLRFDGKTIEPWESPLGDLVDATISNLAALPGGKIAIAMNGRGLFILTAGGQLKHALTTVEYHRIFSLAANEYGILWLTTESSVQKVFYAGGVSIIDQRAGVVVSWPSIVEWNGRISIASQGQLYDMVANEDFMSYRFEAVEHQPPARVWAIDSRNGRMLVGNNTGVYERHEYGFERIYASSDTKALVMTGDDTCIVIGSETIHALVWNGTEWVEGADPIPGVGYPLVVHSIDQSAWIEIGQNLAARVWLEDRKLISKVFDHYPWEEPTWINVGHIDNTIILTGPDNQRIFYEAERDAIVERPDLLKILNATPNNHITRVTEDAYGTIWASHESGVLVMDRAGSDWKLPLFRSFHDRYPRIQLVGSQGAWVSTQSAIYYFQRAFADTAQHHFQPLLTSITDVRTGHQLYVSGRDTAIPQDLPYTQNNLVFQFFAGGYSAMQSLYYEFTIKGTSGEWKVSSSDSILSLPNLREGRYQISIQLMEGGVTASEPLKLSFRVHPPWTRTLWAYLAYGALLLLLIWLVRRLAIQQANRRNIYLEKMVKERTEELRLTMSKLTNEAKNSATLAERNRLAGEMHDSVQQGLSGLVLQLDATLKLSTLEPEIRNRLTVARRMVAYTRQEIQQALWDLESPLLLNAELPEALSVMTQMMTSENGIIDLKVIGEIKPLDSTLQHHLLRIAQESITNAVRHSGSPRIIVSLHYAEKNATLEIKDFGGGFSPRDALDNGPGNFGLRGLRSRAANIQGQLEIVSAPGEGTCIRITVPFPQVQPGIEATQPLTQPK